MRVSDSLFDLRDNNGIEFLPKGGGRSRSSIRRSRMLIFWRRFPQRPPFRPGNRRSASGGCKAAKFDHEIDPWNALRQARAENPRCHSHGGSVRQVQVIGSEDFMKAPLAAGNT